MQWWIQDFPSGGGGNPHGEVPEYDFIKCMKLRKTAWYREKFRRGGGASGTPPRSTTAMFELFEVRKCFFAWRVNTLGFSLTVSIQKGYSKRQPLVYETKCYHWASKTQLTKEIFELTLIHASVILSDSLNFCSVSGNLHCVNNISVLM